MFQKIQGILKLKEGNGHLIFYISSSAVVSYMDKVYSIVRKTYDRGPTDEMEDLNVNAAIWRMFINTNATLRAAVHLGQDYDQNLRFVKNHFWSSFYKKLFKETEKLIKNQTEIIGVSLIDYGDYTWSATSLLCDRILQISNAKTHVFTDSVLCLGGFKEHPNEAWKENIKWYFETHHLKVLHRIDGESMEIEWKTFRGFTTFGLLEKIQKCMEERQCEPQHFEGKIIFMSMFNDILWGEKGNAEKCK